MLKTKNAVERENGNGKQNMGPRIGINAEGADDTERTEEEKREDRKRIFTTEGRRRLRGESGCREEGSGQWRDVGWWRAHWALVESRIHDS